MHNFIFRKTIPFFSSDDINSVREYILFIESNDKSFASANFLKRSFALRINSICKSFFGFVNPINKAICLMQFSCQMMKLNR